REGRLASRSRLTNSDRPALYPRIPCAENAFTASRPRDWPSSNLAGLTGTWKRSPGIPVRADDARDPHPRLEQGLYVAAARRRARQTPHDHPRRAAEAGKIRG